MPHEPLDPDILDQVTVELIFALRESITTISPLDFWSSRITTALETAAAGSSTAAQAITTACRKMQIDRLTPDAARSAVAIEPLIDAHYEQWATHVHQNIVYIVALANVDRARRYPKKDTK